MRVRVRLLLGHPAHTRCAALPSHVPPSARGHTSMHTTHAAAASGAAAAAAVAARRAASCAATSLTSDALTSSWSGLGFGLGLGLGSGSGLGLGSVVSGKG